MMKVEAWCDDDLDVWHWFAGRPCRTNYKTVITFYFFFQSAFIGAYSFSFPHKYMVPPMDMERDMGYLLADGIYPKWPIFMLAIHETEY